MIVTVTANPSVDRTVALAGELTRDSVIRAVSARTEPGGKGVNVARVAQAAGADSVAVLPAHPGDPLLTGLEAVGLPYRAVAVEAEVRSNLTISEPDGTTTKLNLPGVRLDAQRVQALTELVLAAAVDATWVALCGSLPPGMPPDWYVHLCRELSGTGCRVAVDTSGAPLAALASALGAVEVDLLKPNVQELAELAGLDVVELETRSHDGDLTPVLDAARGVSDGARCAVLATLGAAGAVLVTRSGTWRATPGPIRPVSTVGAGDASLAGYLLADLARLPPADALRHAVAYGSAAAALPGTQPPSPADVAPAAVQVSEVATPAA